MADSSSIPVLDTDTHVVEPPDLWTSRLPAKWAGQGPVVRWDEERKLEAWFLGETFLKPVGSSAVAEWPEPAPCFPARWSDVAAFMWDPAARLERMDRDGIRAQVLYPNVSHFSAITFASQDDLGLSLACIRAYNDYLADFISVAPDRYVAVSSIPFWDLEASLEEIKRCLELGHKGVTMTQDPTRFGLPALGSAHWDPLWAALQEAGLSVNFHVGSGGDNKKIYQTTPEYGAHANAVFQGAGIFMGNIPTIAALICGGVCHRFPRLNFVAVESGVGWVPFLLDLLDWQWLNCGVRDEHPEYDLMPSEYFRRQIYASFWFERATLKPAVERLGIDNIFYETDFPHTTSMTPGPASAAVPPRQYISEVLDSVPHADASKILWDNAAGVYHLQR